MNILVFIVLTLVILALAIYAVNLLPFIDPWLKQLINVVCVVIAILVVLNRINLMVL